MVLCSSIITDYTRLDKKRFPSHPAMAPRVNSVNKYVPLSTTHSTTTASSRGFRLKEPLADESESIYSAYKQKIDLLFTESTDATVQKFQEKINQCVQVKIEKMFSEISKDVGDTITEVSSHAFIVDYLGSVPLPSKVTSLVGLQDPLKTLYFAYKKSTRQNLSGRLIITSQGLKVRYQNEGEQEQVNPFPTIAVWSAVKFVINTKSTGVEFAFLPLVTDPDNNSKTSLFQSLPAQDQRYILKDNHAPLFAVVMKKMGGSKQLECHGFVCQTSEDAIVIAATLYKSLMSFMARKTSDKQKLRNQNGISCVSVASSDMNYVKSVPIRPPRKKRSSTSSVRSSEVSQRSKTNLVRKESKPKRSGPKIPSPKLDSKPEPPPRIDANKIKLDSPNNRGKIIEEAKLLVDAKPKVPLDISADELKNAFESDGQEKELRSLGNDNSGDILTKVTIPRSGSFLNAKGLTRYKSINKSNGKSSGGSPIGFNELFNEFRIHEGLNSVDEILGAIIDAEGMSFNDLKPIYKEFLLKLALTLTKDELFQHAKSIMRRQKKRIKRTNSSAQRRRRKILVGAKGLRKIFKKSFNKTFSRKLKSKKGKAPIPKNIFDLVEEKPLAPPSNSSLSTSSFDTRQFSPKQITDKIIQKPHGNYRSRLKEYHNDRPSTSEESDFFTLQRPRHRSSDLLPPQNIIPVFQDHSIFNTHNRNSSSGYVSCSECSYDSETCTCVSAARCYCSLDGKQKKQKRQKSGHSQKNERSNYYPLKQLPRNVFPLIPSEDFIVDKSMGTLSSCKTEDKCYCSLKNFTCPHDPEFSYRGYSKDYVEKYPHMINNMDKSDRCHHTEKRRCYCSVEKDRSMPWSVCDTDSCNDSVYKCYCYSDAVDVVDVPNEDFRAEVRPRDSRRPDKLKKSKPSKTAKPTGRSKRHNGSYTVNDSLGSRVSSVETLHNALVESPLAKRHSTGSADNFNALDYDLFHSKDHNRNSRRSSRYSGEDRRRSPGSSHSPSFYEDHNSLTTIESNQDSALSMKKSAEIVAMFANIKLSQTTDISHLMADKSENLSARINNHLEEQRKIIMEQKRQQDSITKNIQMLNEQAKRSNRNSPSGTGKFNRSGSRRSSGKYDLYSSQNGLYTIQSQSDDSGLKSEEEKRKNGKEELNGGGTRVSSGQPSGKLLNSNTNELENSLGYLP